MQDRHGGVIVQTDVSSFPRTVREFVQKLQESLVHWTENNASSVWLKFELPQHASVCICRALCSIPMRTQKSDAILEVTAQDAIQARHVSTLHSLYCPV